MYVNMKAILEDAQANGYGVMAMNSCNIEMARGGVLAAQALCSPLILQISPKQMVRHAHAEEMCSLVRGLAERANVPICLNYDHGMLLEGFLSAIRNGFTNVMFDGSRLPFEENVRRTRIICGIAHASGVSVEAELGHVGKAVDGDNLNVDYLTDPQKAKEFVQRTDVDCLAIAIGTAHGTYPKGKTPTLDFERLDAIRTAVCVPLVLHGGSGTGESNIREAIRRGISKINVATDAFDTAQKGFLQAAQEDPAADYIALSAASEKAVCSFASDFIRMVGSVGRISFEELP